MPIVPDDGNPTEGSFNVGESMINELVKIAKTTNKINTPKAKVDTRLNEFLSFFIQKFLSMTLFYSHDLQSFKELFQKGEKTCIFELYP